MGRTSLTTLHSDRHCGIGVALAVAYFIPALAVAAIVGFCFFYYRCFGLWAALNSKPLTAIGSVGLAVAIARLRKSNPAYRGRCYWALRFPHSDAYYSSGAELETSKVLFFTALYGVVVCCGACVLAVAVLNSSLAVAAIVGFPIFVIALFTINALMGPKILKIFTAIGIVGFGFAELGVALAIISARPDSAALAVVFGFFFLFWGSMPCGTE